MIGHGDLPFASLKCVFSGNICYQAQSSNLTSKSSFTPEEKAFPVRLATEYFAAQSWGVSGERGGEGLGQETETQQINRTTLG